MLLKAWHHSFSNDDRGPNNNFTQKKMNKCQEFSFCIVIWVKSVFNLSLCKNFIMTKENRSHHLFLLRNGIQNSGTIELCIKAQS